MLHFGILLDEGRKAVLEDSVTTYSVTAYPYAVQHGKIKIPNSITDVYEYITEHWNEIAFDEPELDYQGTDFDFMEDKT